MKAQTILLPSNLHNYQHVFTSPLLPHDCYSPINLDFHTPLVWSLSPKHPIISCVWCYLFHPQILFSLHPTSPIPYYAITPYTPGIPGRESFSLIHLTTFCPRTRSRSLALLLLIRLLHFAPCCCSSDSYSLYDLVSLTTSH